MYFVLVEKIGYIVFLFISSTLFLVQTVLASDLIQLTPIALKDNLLDFPNSIFINRDNIINKEAAAAFSVGDLIKNKTNIDIKQRGLFDIQSDLNIRASNFEQSLVVVDGISLSDPQTSHYSMDIPVKCYDWQSVSVLKGLSSSFYGSHAIGGVIEVDTITPKENSLKFSSFIGEKQLRIFNISLDRISEQLNYHLGVQESSSASYREETDFKSFNIFSKVIFNDIFGSPRLTTAKGSKKFGASSFYASNYPREEDHIETDLYMLGFDFLGDDLIFSPVIYFRRHWSEFTLDRSNPSLFKNISTNYIRGIKLPFKFVLFDSVLNLSLEAREEEIDSTNIGRHLRSLLSLSAAASKELLDRFSCLVSLRIDNYSSFDTEINPGVYLKYKLTKERNLFLSFQRAYRVPSFTDLYYSSPANLGNPNLSAENSLGIELGYVNNGILSYGASIFRRFDYDLIDWVKDSDLDPWKAQNVSYAKVDGAEGWISYNNFKCFYALFNKEHKSGAPYSKYVANYLKYNFGVLQKIKTGYLDIDLSMSYKERIGGNGSFNLDLVLSRNVILNGNSVDFYLKMMNLTNVSRFDIEGVQLPGRWISAGMAITF